MAEQFISNVYKFLTSELTLSSKHTHELIARGFDMEQINSAGYKTWPAARDGLADRCRQAFGDLSGVPGFYKNPSGRWVIGGARGIAIPIYDKHENITCIKIRLDNPINPAQKYILLSSDPKPDKKTGEVKYRNGTRANLEIHWPKPFPGSLKLIRITEGEFKAHIASIMTGIYTISLPGVTSWRKAIPELKAMKPDKVFIAYDSDKENPIVTSQGTDDRPGLIGQSLVQLYIALQNAGLNAEIEDWDSEYGKGIDDVLINGHEDKIQSMSRDDLNEFISKHSPELLNNEWIYIIGTKRFINVKTKQELDKEQYRDKFSEVNVKKDPVAQAIKNPAFKKVDYPTYEPSKPLFINNGETVCLNLWVPPEVEPKEGDATKFVDHLKYIVPNANELDTLINYLAYNVQCPGSKIHWAMLIQGTQGTGKSYIGDVMRRILGAKNVSMPSNEELHETYTAWQRACQLVIVEEMMARGRLELMNKLKPMITQNTTIVREMYKPTYEQPNTFNFLLFTNHEDAIVLSESDRRYCVIFSPAVPKKPQYYEDLWMWTERNIGVILNFLKSVDLSNFKPKAHAPMTMAKKAVIEQSRLPVEAWVFESIETESWPFSGDIVSAAAIAECAPSYVGRTSPKQIANAMKAAGAVQLGQVRLSNGSAARLWAIRRHEVWVNAGPESQAQEFERWSDEKEPGGNNPLLSAKPY